jgi:hypothetical protein
MNDNEWFGKEIIITGDVQYIGDGEDPKDNQYMQAYAKALKEIYAEKKEVIETENPS